MMEARQSSCTGTIPNYLPHEYFAFECDATAVSALAVETSMVCSGIQAEIHRFRWEAAPAAVVRPQVCHLILVLNRGALESSVRISEKDAGEVAVGDCLFIPAHQDFAVEGPPTDCRNLSCQFDLQTLQNFLEAVWTPQQLAASFDINNPAVRSGLTIIAGELQTPGFASGILVESTATSVLVQLARHFKVSHIATETSNKLSPRQYKRIEDIIKNSVAAPPSLRELASECGISHRHFTRTFKNTTGQTLSQYITDARVEQAKQLLAKHDAMIKIVAYDCGFQSQSAFAAAFRKATGWPPRQFRRVALGLTTDTDV